MNLLALAAAATMILMTAGSTASSALFVEYRQQWGISSADIAIVFSVYVGTLLPVLIFFGGLAERFGRRRVTVAGIVSMAAGLAVLTVAHSLPWLIAARLLQGAGVGLSIGAVSAAFAESFQGSTPGGTMLQRIASIGLFTGPVISSAAFNLGGGLNLSYVPVLVLVMGLLVLVPFIVERKTGDAALQAREEPLADAVVKRALRFALPAAFISWAGLSLYLSLVPAYLASTLHALNPAIGAAAVVACQLASLAVSVVFRHAVSERSGSIACAVNVAGLALLVAGTSTNSWALIVVATLMVGAGAGVASATAFSIGGAAGRGQRARIFARLYTAAYAGYSIPALAIGLIAVHTSFTIAFSVVIAALAVMAAALPLLRARERATVSCPQRRPLAA